jgi:hypothetical protein
MDSQAVIVMDSLADHDQVAMFNGLMLNRIYWYRKLTGVKEKFRHLLVLEEFHVMSSAEFSKGESRIDFLIKMCREFSQGVMVIEQNPGNISQSVLGNLNAIISMNLGHVNDINAVSTAMVLNGPDRKHLGKLPTGWAICRVKDRFPESVLVRVDFETIDKSEPLPEEIRRQNGDFVPEGATETWNKKPIWVGPLTVFPGREKLTPLNGKMLRYLATHDGANLKNCYLSLGLSYGRGDRVRNRLLKRGLIWMDEKVPTSTGTESRLYLTDKGNEYMSRTEEVRRLGGEWHRSAVQDIAAYYESMGYLVRTEYRDIDIYAERNGEKIGIEVESLSGGKDFVQAVWNIQKALALGVDRVESVVKNKESAKKLKDAIQRSPVERKEIERIKIRLINRI